MEIQKKRKCLEGIPHPAFGFCFPLHFTIVPFLCHATFLIVYIIRILKF